MGYRLALAEKPSVAQAIAKVLGATKRCDGYLEGNGWLVSWCVGHLVELAEPESYDENASTRKQFVIVKQLMNREDITEIAECTDSGREGELIYRLVYHKCGCRKPFHRLWISSMEDAAIREGFADLRPSNEYDNLYEAALCRERADWIVGMNATRLFSCLYGQTLAVGRVMTPTLAMVVMRDAAIDAFKSEPFFTVRISMNGVTAESVRFSEQAEAARLADLCERAGAATVKKAERKEKTEKPPSLYDLTSLQRDANRILGFTAQQTLDYTQSLYEKKLVTYPRTDSRYLTDDMAALVPGLVKEVAAVYGIREELPVTPGQVINSSKVSDHHAIIPTKTMPGEDLSGLPSGEQAILRLIAARLIASVGEVHRYAETTVVLDCAGAPFTAKGKTVLRAGWKGVESRIRPVRSKEKEGKTVLRAGWKGVESRIRPVRSKEKEPASLPEIKTGEILPLSKTEIHEGKTNPPRHFTEDTLLQAMETASADEFPEEVERKGIGTPATRAATIEKLVQKGFVERRGDKKTKFLCATQKGTALITVMPEQIQSPSMTADWEEKLLRIEKGEYSSESFME